MAKPARGKSAKSPPSPPTPRPPRNKPADPIIYHSSLGLGSALVGAVALWYSLSRQWTWEPWVASWLASINVVAFAHYGLDKMRARSTHRRIPEVVLHLLALAGGSVGAYLGMRTFRHKTVKGMFRVIFWLIVAFQVVLIAWVVKELWFTPST